MKYIKLFEDFELSKPASGYDIIMESPHSEKIFNFLEKELSNLENLNGVYYGVIENIYGIQNEAKFAYNKERKHISIYNQIYRSLYMIYGLQVIEVNSVLKFYIESNYHIDIKTIDFKKTIMPL